MPAVREACNPQMFTAELLLNPKVMEVVVVDGWKMMAHFPAQKIKVIFGGFQAGMELFRGTDNFT